MTSRLNQQSLIQMAIRHKTSIQASAFRSRLLSILNSCLIHLIEQLSLKTLEPAELIEMEKDLETLEAALVHLWISFPYNETLFLPKTLNAEQGERLKAMARQARNFRSTHLRLAHSRAA